MGNLPVGKIPLFGSSGEVRQNELDQNLVGAVESNAPAPCDPEPPAELLNAAVAESKDQATPDPFEEEVAQAREWREQPHALDFPERNFARIQPGAKRAKKTNFLTILLIPFLFIGIFGGMAYFVTGEIPFRDQVKPLFQGQIKPLFQNQIRPLLEKYVPMERFSIERLSRLRLAKKDEMIARLPHKEWIAEYVPILGDMVQKYLDKKKRARQAIIEKRKKRQAALERYRKDPARYWEKLPPNPYRDLRNAYDVPPLALGKVWTKDQQQELRTQQRHPFHYQRYRLIGDVAEKRLKGSEVILWEALKSKKLWIRMKAVMGLADFGFPLQTKKEVLALHTKSVVIALGKEPSERVENFFKRFITKNTSGERYVMREAMRVVDKRSRFVILQALARVNDRMTPQYLAAAAKDPSKKIERWVPSAIARPKTVSSFSTFNKKSINTSRPTPKTRPRVKGGQNDKVIKFKANQKLHVEQGQTVARSS